MEFGFGENLSKIQIAWKEFANPGRTPVFQPVATPQPGDVIWFPGHMGIYDPAPTGKRKFPPWTDIRAPETVLSARSTPRMFEYGEPRFFGKNPKYFRYTTTPGEPCP